MRAASAKPCGHLSRRRPAGSRRSDEIMEPRDLYQVLGVERRATQEEIKQAYRRLAREAHPDVRRDDPHAEERFKEINEAYSILGDPAKRGQYDRFGRVTPQTWPPSGTGMGPFDDLFDIFFGGRHRAAAEPEGPARGADLRHDLELTLEEVAIGVERHVRIERLETCPSCFGTGAERGSRPERCPACEGTGEVRYAQRTVFGHLTQVATCGQCRGSGTYIEHPCAGCRGSGQSMAEREVSVRVPAGVEDGMHLRIPKEGEAGSRGGARGDLYVVIQVEPHPVFTRRGRDLTRELPISMTRAALGDLIRFDGLEGSEEVTVPPGTQPGDTLTVRGRGLPDLQGGRGHLHLAVRVVIPKRISAAQRTLLESLSREIDERRDDGEGRGGEDGAAGADEPRRASGRRKGKRPPRPIFDRMKDLLK